MTKGITWTLRAMALLASLGIAIPLHSQSTSEGKAEFRVFVLDKVGSPVDIHQWTGVLEVTPEHGAMRTFPLEPAAPWKAGKEHSKAAPEPERYSNSQEFTARTESPADGEKGYQNQTDGQSDRGAAEVKDRMLCGEARKLDDGWVEMVVVWPKMHRGQHAEHAGVVHDHGAWYFRSTLDPAMVQDPKTQTINFSVKATFTTPSGDTKYVKGFTYPTGMVDGVLGHLIDKDFKDTSRIDHDQAVRISHQIHAALDGLPALSFAKDKDRQEYEKARQDCLACAQRLETAAATEISKAADECKSAIKEVRSQAADAQGALMAQ
ncbi:MAG TPA: hypothetical protein VKW04_23360 [Planctomycetota bacterium]|nr:hypothetical protein [Planctomycetota bacterium]